MPGFGTGRDIFNSGKIWDGLQDFICACGI